MLRAGELATTDAVRTQNAPFLVQRALTSREYGPLVWEFVRDHWGTIETRFPRTLIARMLEGIAWLVDDASVQSVPAHMAAHPVPEGERVIAQHLERQRVHRALVDRGTRALHRITARRSCGVRPRTLTFPVSGGRYRGRMPPATSSAAMHRFSEPVRAWFETSFAAPTAAQEQGWPAIAAGDHSLILAPTGSGKTLAAFLWAIDRLATTPEPDKADRCRVLYISPLRALAVDVEKNLRAPIAGISLAAERLGVALRTPSVGMRTGDTPGKDRQALVRTPPDILITTPESLYLMLTSRARESLRSVEYVIIDEIHAMAPTKRGAHLMLSLERLDEIAHRPPQRIGLSATQRPLDEIARFLGGFGPDRPRPVTIVDAGSRKDLQLEIIVPVDDMAELAQNPAPPTDAPIDGPIDLAVEPRASIWPHIHPRLVELIREHHTTLVFCNARRLSERLAASLNDLAGEELVRAHHGSLSREQRLVIESDLKAGRLKAIVATSSLELGIDMGSVDLVVLVESPGSVARGMQRVGRAGHQVGEPSTGKIFPKYRGDLLEATAVARRMREGLVEEMRYPRNPIDVLAQQIVAAVAVDEWDVDALYAMVRRSANFAELSEDVFREVLDMLAGRYPSDRFAGLRPRVVWDRVQGRVRAREGAQRVAIASGGTIPDRGLFGVFLPDGVRVGELDEEMVYESRGARRSCSARPRGGSRRSPSTASW